MNHSINIFINNYQSLLSV